MKRTIVGFHADDDDDWVGELSCGHNQHLRHRPPFQIRPWVLEETGRAEHLGSAIDCPLCDRAEMPEGLSPLGTSAVWDETTMPDGLRRSHRVAAGRWGLINVLEGRLRFRAEATPAIDTVLVPGSSQAIPPEMSHEVEALGHVRFEITWLSKSTDIENRVGEKPAPQAVSRSPRVDSEGGDPACWLHLICPTCGLVIDDGAHNHQDAAR